MCETIPICLFCSTALKRLAIDNPSLLQLLHNIFCHCPGGVTEVLKQVNHCHWCFRPLYTVPNGFTFFICWLNPCARQLGIMCLSPVWLASVRAEDWFSNGCLERSIPSKFSTSACMLPYICSVYNIVHTYRHLHIAIQSRFFMRGRIVQVIPSRQHAYHEYSYMQIPHNAVTPYVVTTYITKYRHLHTPQEPVCKQVEQREHHGRGSRYGCCTYVNYGSQCTRLAASSCES